MLAIDTALGRLIDGITARGLGRSVNLVVVSDHGMTDVSPRRVLYLDDFVDLDLVQIDFEGTIAGLRPHEGISAEEIRDRFKNKHRHLGAFLVEELPQRFAFAGHRRIPPVILLPDIGWQIATRAKAATWDPRTMKGAHGYDPELPEMGALFIGTGPAFKEHLVIDRADNIDVYDLICAILDVEPAPNDGSTRLADAVLKSSPGEG